MSETNQERVKRLIAERDADVSSHGRSLGMEISMVVCHRVGPIS